jgi:ABC-type glycerol-3-phosphate transport system substrate-binding protein
MVKVKTAFTVLVMVSLLGIAACSNDDGDEGGTTGTSAKEGSEPILIKTRVAPQNARDETSGEVFSDPPLVTQPSAPGGASSMAPMAT